jgi:YidC/Oxa1 family membrane protein insertase
MLIFANVVQPLVDVCRSILEFWHDLIGDFAGSWGWAIILLTFTVRLAILPLTFKGVKSMQRLQQLQPEIKRLQERYKEDKQRMNQEVMRFYQEQKVNPLGSCLPLALQIPFFIALFSLLRSSSFRHDIASNPGFLFIDDLAHKVTQPAVLVTLIVVYIATQLASTMVTTLSADKTQQRIMYALPFVFATFIVRFPAGLIVYWITTNVWTVGQQLLVRKMYPKPEPIGPRDSEEERKPARGKPTTDGAAAEGATKAKASVGTDGGNGGSAKPPPPPRKRKKRSGRRR